MSYLQDKKVKQKKILKISFFVISFFILLYFRLGIWNGLSYVVHKIFRPVLIVADNVGEKFGNINSFVASKNSLDRENADLRSKLNEGETKMINYNSILSENINLKEILGRKDEKTTFILSAILGKPNQSPYDTLIIDVGIKDMIKIGDLVFALGNVPIGAIAKTYLNSSKVVLFSNSGEKTQVVLGNKDIFMEAVGRGGGNFEVFLPRDFTLSKGDQVVLPGIRPYVLGIVETIISDPRDSFQKALLVSPVNIQELKFVQVEVSAK